MLFTIDTDDVSIIDQSLKIGFGIRHVLHIAIGNEPMAETTATESCFDRIDGIVHTATE